MNFFIHRGLFLLQDHHQHLNKEKIKKGDMKLWILPMLQVSPKQTL